MAPIIEIDGKQVKTNIDKDKLELAVVFVREHAGYHCGPDTQELTKVLGWEGLHGGKRTSQVAKVACKIAGFQFFPKTRRTAAVAISGLEDVHATIREVQHLRAREQAIETELQEIRHKLDKLRPIVNSVESLQAAIRRMKETP